MVGKGQRRREKNYRAAHGGHSRLPPPPKPTDVDALPSKLRRIIDFTSHTNNNNTFKQSLNVATDGQRTRKRKDGVSETNPVTASGFKMTASEDGGSAENLTNPKNKDRKAKRKRKQVDDLRFDSVTQVLGSTGLKRRERKKKYLEAKKKKHKKVKQDDMDFPRHEDIKFGEIVEAPPKLSAIPKALKKTAQDASSERLRLQAVETYRKRKGWASRPGVQLPGSISLNPSF